MALTALVMSKDQQSLRVLTTALRELGIEQDCCSTSDAALQRLLQGHYSGAVLDFDVAGAAQVGKVARMKDQRQPVLFALVGPSAVSGDTSQAGTNVVLYKPLELEQVRCSLRAGRDLMGVDRRHTSRHKIATLVYLQFDRVAMPAMMLDLSEQGLSLQAPESLPPVREVPLRFMLPGTSHMLEALAEVIWSDPSGRAGVFFAQMKPATRKYLKNWLSRHGVRKRDAVRVLMPPEKPRRPAHAPFHR